ncbi:hypothetical protein C0Q70_06367 [Pomacea canaliculata]|uniref:Uncharacterized protein n=1 Tax=Pomacea canaliculata TaxID=400727 RepID=A0A2T7PNS9_POMCA|nr:hypothetical protein C0Q70_06367 [Pomacea canaliculata]
MNIVAIYGTQRSADDQDEATSSQGVCEEKEEKEEEGHKEKEEEGVDETAFISGRRIESDTCTVKVPEAGDKGRLLPLCFKYGGQPKVGGRDLTSPMRQTPGRRQKEVGPEVDGRHLRKKNGRSSADDSSVVVWCRRQECSSA